ncbi:MAG: TIGR01777 family oxidoreductase, partial [Myxococcota bacterium]|nr:TIGR01777 family oxidoreductase [Myxococcota bacterium]
MKILITGATGLVGRALCLRLLRDGHQVTALVRSMRRGVDLLGAEVKILDVSVGLDAALEGQDGVVHLAGEPLAGRRWSASRRRRMVESRVGMAQALSDAMQRSTQPPQVFLTASAVGYYGAQEQEVDERSGAGTGFLADLCVRWEAAAFSAEAHGVRVASFRTGLVLEPDGGALRMMELPYRLGLGGVMGDGKQGLSWIHLDDLVDAMAQALSDPRYEGPINAVSPEPASQRSFHRALCDAMGRPGPWWIPGPILRLVLGESSQVVLEGQRVLPARLQDLGFSFRYPSLKPALDSFYGPDEGLQIGSLEGPVSREHPYLARRRPRYQLQDNRLLPSSL